ncbi:MAG: MBL fold metallo-hydrolase [Polyangiaceae bacterium]|jgi:phosphoribosyl 1,2-cyclic phosphodiesterase|nr:MBL fold metallo-hydrolase [Polyangiaceae bacterium]
MRVRFHGVRGSTPTPGASTVRYGGNTSCVEVRLADGSLLIFDAGTGIRECGLSLLQEGFSGPIHLMLSHLHWDHVLGLPFFGPIWRKDTVLRVMPMLTEAQQQAAQARTLFDGLHFPVRAEHVPARIELLPEATSWRVGSAVVRRVPLNHPGGAQGFRVDDADGRSLTYLTDNELSPPTSPQISLDALARFAENVDLLIHDAQYIEEDFPLKKGWGHSTIGEVIELGQLASARHLALYHHEPTRDDDALDALDREIQASLREQKSPMQATMAREGWVLDL